MRRISVRRVLIIGLRTVITLLFVPAMVAKLGQPAAWGRLFVTWGYPAWGAAAVSLVEIAGLIALWIPAVVPVALVALMCTLSGATATWLIHGHRLAATYPGTILVLVLILAGVEVVERRTTTTASNQRSPLSRHD